MTGRPNRNHETARPAVTPYLGLVGSIQQGPDVIPRVTTILAWTIRVLICVAFPLILLRFPSTFSLLMETPVQIVVRLDEDYNWWLEPTTENPRRDSVLDPRQVAHLREALIEYRPQGLRQEQFEAAFTFYTLEAELEEGQVRLRRENGHEVFALPVLGDDSDGPYYDFLDALAKARIQKLNATHQYVQNCTEDEMFAELEALDAERYFNDEVIHCFEQLNEILEWKPAEWDDASAS